jgi:hypothetical protein
MYIDLLHANNVQRTDFTAKPSQHFITSIVECEHQQGLQQKGTMDVRQLGWSYTHVRAGVLTFANPGQRASLQNFTALKQ